MVTRITVGAFLSCENKVLLMKRGLHKELGAGLWAGIGGHLDLEDIKNPRAIDFIETCYREVWEEAGIEKSDIRGLTLKYIGVRKVDNEIRMNYFYFGEIENEIPLPKCDEGDFFWVDKGEIINLPMSRTVKEAVKNWVKNPADDNVYFIIVSADEDSAVISQL